MANFRSLNSVLVSIIIFAVGSVDCQISTPCTNSLISGFTPCISFVTGSSRNGSLPTKECCDSLKSLVKSSMGCACLIVTGNVPFSIPFIQNLAISLPKMCKYRVPIQCKASSVPLPAPGPVLFGPPLPPVASAPGPSIYAPGPKPRDLKASAVASSPHETTLQQEPPTVATIPTAHPQSRPMFNTKSDSNPSYVITPTYLLIILKIMVLEFY